MDLGSIHAAIASTQAILGIAKGVKDATLSQAIVSAVIDLQSKLIATGETALKIQEDNRLLLDQVAELTRKLQTQKDVVFHHDAYWKKDAKGEQGPFCPTCWDKDNDLVRPSFEEVLCDRDKVSLVCGLHTQPRWFQIPKGLWDNRR